MREVNHLVVRGKSGSVWRFVGNFSADGLVIYGGGPRTCGNQITFEHVTVSRFSAGFQICGDHCRLLDFTTHENGWTGGWFNGAQHVEVRRFTSFKNNRRNAGNTDGLNLQDVAFALVDDAEIYGQYDGLDIGSQKTAPGCSFVIVRNVRAHSNKNTNFPNSTTIAGPVVFEYCQSWDNRDWGSAVSYEGSRNVHYWNCTFANVSTAINDHEPPKKDAKMIVRNCLFALADGKTALRGPATLDADYNRASAGVHYQGGVVPGPNCTTGPILFRNAAANDFRLKENDNPQAIDRGVFFLKAARAGATTTRLEVDGDPRLYFWHGDTIQIAGTGRRTATTLTATTITLDQSATFAPGAGVHLPWNGPRPDLGACETGESRR